MTLHSDLLFYFSLTSADKRWWINYTDTSLTDSEISDNHSLIILVSPQHNDLKYHKTGPDPAWNK